MLRIFSRLENPSFLSKDNVTANSVYPCERTRDLLIDENEYPGRESRWLTKWGDSRNGDEYSQSGTFVKKLAQWSKEFQQ